MQLIGWVHVAAGIGAIGAGAMVLAMRKGTAGHRAMGGAYALSMLIINGSALTIFDLNGRANIFHLLALVNLTSVSLGMIALWRWRRSRSPAHLRQHQQRMCMSYLGLVMAFVTELAVNPFFGLTPIDPRPHFWQIVGAMNLAMFAAGYLLIAWTLGRAARANSQAAASQSAANIPVAPIRSPGQD